MANGIDGIVSGIDTTGLINSIVAISKAPRNQIAKQLTSLQSKRQAVAGLSNRMQGLADAIGAMSTAKDFNAMSATVSDTTALDATATPTATAGSYNLEVLSLARAESYSSAGFADPALAGTIAQGTYSVSVAGVATNVTIDATNDSIDGLATALNGVGGLSAYVVNTGAASNPYQLVVQGDTGTANTVDLSALPTAFTQAQTATDAQVKVNGVTVTSGSNQLEPVPGLTLNLKGIGTSQVSIASDTTAMVAKVQGIVDAYNEIQTHYEAQTVYNTDLNLKGPLIGESTVRRAVDGLANMVTQSYAVGGAYDALSKIGISTGRDGKLTLDSVALTAALTTDSASVTTLLTDAGGPLAAMKARIEDAYVDPINGTLKSRSNALENSISETEDRITKFDASLAKQTARLRARFNAMEQAMGQAQAVQAQLAAMFASSPTPS